jgi:hypothetical protein
MGQLVCALIAVAVGCGDEATLGSENGGTGGNGASGGAGGSAGVILTDGGAGDGATFEGCVAVGEVAQNTVQPATVVLFIDNSPSMRDEILWTRDNMNRFSQTITSAGLDLQVVVIACMENGDCDGHPNAWGICIPDPLGATGGCDDPPPYDDTNLPGYLHVDTRIPSVKGFERVMDTYDQWIGMVRPNTVLHIVGISDDTEEWSAAQFNDALLARNPALAGYFFHGIFSYQSKEDACAVSTSDPCCLYAAPSGEGVPYRDLVTMTGGVQADLCAQDFDPVFQQFATAVIESAQLSCEWAIPAPPAGETLNPNMVNVEFIDGAGASNIVGRVMSADECASVAQGWFYDNPTDPKSVLMCPQTCDWIQGQVGAEIRIQFGCATEFAAVR